MATKEQMIDEATKYFERRSAEPKKGVRHLKWGLLGFILGMLVANAITVIG